MSGIDLSKRVVNYVENGRRIAQAAVEFKVVGQRYIGGSVGQTFRQQR
ncbi:MAG: hypothetical protein RLZZ338_2797 [Cyanobacteriota bacterium]|jgi:hypothetical protein